MLKEEFCQSGVAVVRHLGSEPLLGLQVPTAEGPAFLHVDRPDNRVLRPGQSYPIDCIKTTGSLRLCVFVDTFPSRLVGFLRRWGNLNERSRYGKTLRKTKM